ncbi:MAG: hypothetical protein ABSB14_22670 [Candidatus Sulfotelmatobacter sp.]|jgi:hypothetical protein
MSARKNIAKAWLNLNGIATPDGAHPTGRRVSVLRTKIGGALISLIGLVTGYFFILQPLEEARRGGVLKQGLFGLVMPITLVYVGVAILVTDLRDEKTMRAGAEGRLWWTSKGRIFQCIMWGAISLTLIAWYLYVRSTGLNPF